ncbi:hypothetical protein ANME2D_00496 [Candidatus Methanoperedens nitroreducens]|uniref:Methyltransferase type 11 domain-containing protein n=1 Tax=Candidatus Methanoperedens nitratireducens TaxID=1392998 RepID=A0A062VE40_9EURY|nr:hypothetical protein [Candidatus Methanoperedens nitroreducens]KCZ73430.1 hypothetical protein ANME2D_00496 [Candidatus Methanoperedens nitroreducens]MDJ1422615.1 hypothetical protein [Candidatus Methanoperedens sp.]
MDRIARSVNQLYERYPYPSLPIRSEHDLIIKLHANVMSKILATAELVPESLSGKEILDAGCGTGEKSCYFSYYVFCLGVLHHTSGPYLRFCVLADLCKPGGTVTVGLYNRYGRLVHRIRRLQIGLNAGENIDKRLEYVERSIYRRKLKSTHEQAYAADKYVNPYESYHSVGEVLGWFDKNDITYTGSYPHTGTGRFHALSAQLKWLIKRNGFFIISGRKN